MDKQILTWLRDEITVEPYEGVDGRGKVKSGRPYMLACYVSGERKMVRNEFGEEVVSNETVYLEATEQATRISFKDQITLPDGRMPVILAKQIFKDEHGRRSVMEVNL